MSGTTDYTPVPTTNGYSPFVPSPGVEIHRITPSDGGTGSTSHTERVYPMPEQNGNPLR